MVNRNYKAPDGGETRKPRYNYKLCPNCGERIHAGAHYCGACKKPAWKHAAANERAEEKFYYTEREEYAVFGKRLCSPDRRPFCGAAERGEECRYAKCWGTGKGECGACNKYADRRFQCCRRYIRREREAEAESRTELYPVWRPGRK